MSPRSAPKGQKKVARKKATAKETPTKKKTAKKRTAKKSAGSDRRTSLDAIFRPRSIAVVGASSKSGNIGRQILENLLRSGFHGTVFPVNPSSRVVMSMKCYPRVSAIPDAVDLAIIAVPAARVLDVVRDCGRKKVKGLVVITAGFRETGDAGVGLESKLEELVERHGMRMVGPNCMGVMNTAENVRLNGSFATVVPRPGSVAFVSQSGALGEVIITMAREAGIGLSMFVSLGNKTDINGNDLLSYWADDPETQQILMYLESFGAPREFTRIAREVTRTKPIITVKAGRTQAGARAASSHTGSIVGRDFAADSLFEQCGVIRVNSMQEMLTLATAFSNQPLPRGDRVAILTNAGGPGILVTDACVHLDLELAELEPATLAGLRKLLPDEASVQNPVDTTASGQPEDFGAALRLLKKDRTVDSIIVLFVSPVMIDGLEVARCITGALSGCSKPVMSCFMGKHRAAEGIATLRAAHIPVFPFPEEAAHALSAMSRFREHKKRRVGKLVEFDVDRSQAARVLRAVMKDGRRELRDEEVRTILDAYGIPLAPSRLCESAAEAIDFGLEVGYPIVLKAVSEQLSHKTEAGGVVLDLRSGDEVGAAYNDLVRRVRKIDPDVRVLAQAMIRGGREVILGMVDDPQFGPLIMFGLGGIYVEILRDVSVRIHPITDLDADDMVRSTGGYPLLAGVRGEKPVQFKLLREQILRLSQLISDFDEICEMDINPFIISPRGGVSAAVDARISVRAPGECDAPSGHAARV